jgi:hypothetical protein
VHEGKVGGERVREMLQHVHEGKIQDHTFVIQVKLWVAHEVESSVQGGGVTSQRCVGEFSDMCKGAGMEDHAALMTD